MDENYEIIIDADIDKEKNINPPNSKEEQVNSFENEYLNEIAEGNQIKYAQRENEEYNDFENNNEAEEINNNVNSDINNNIILQLSTTDRQEYNQDKKIISQKDSTTTVNNTNINDNISTIPTKEEQNFESNIQNQNINFQNNIINNNNIIDESEEYRSLENIINSKDNDISKNQIIFNKNFLNNNKIYFTETNIQTKKLKNVLQKSNSTNLYNIITIPEYPKGYPKNSNIQNKSKSSKKKLKNSINEKLNNLSPDDYMKKRFVNKYNFHPLQYRIQKIKEEIEKQNKYDYERVMKELQLKYDKNKKSKDKEKYILEYNQKFEEKLKNMEEKRFNLNNQRLQKILKKLRKSDSSNNIKNKNRNNSNKSYDNNFTTNIKNNMTLSNKNTNTMDSYGYTYEKSDKLPLIENTPKYKIVKMIKEKNEEEFCAYTLQKIKENEKCHRINYLKQINSINSNILKKNKLYRQRSMHCLISAKNKYEKLKEELIEKDIMKRYKIKQILIREHSAKNERIKNNLIKSIGDIKVKRDIIQKQEEKKIKQIIKKLNRDNKKQFLNENNRDFFSNLQKKNYIRYNKEMNDYYNELILRQGENLLIIDELQKDEPYIKQDILKRSLQEQNVKNKELKSLDKFLDKMDKRNIYNQNERIKKEIFQKKIKIENEAKRKEEEE